MLGESQLNVYILGAELSQRQRQRIQAQVQTALRSLPSWAFGLLSQRIDSLGVRNLPLVVEPLPEGDRDTSQVISLGHIDTRPAVRLLPRLSDSDVIWGQDQRHLVAKAVAFMAAPQLSDDSFWRRWSRAIEADDLRRKAGELNPEWNTESDLGLLIEMFAAYVLTPGHSRWADLPAIKVFLDTWR